eukprot:g18526.t1
MRLQLVGGRMTPESTHGKREAFLGECCKRTATECSISLEATTMSRKILDAIARIPGAAAPKPASWSQEQAAKPGTSVFLEPGTCPDCVRLWDAQDAPFSRQCIARHNLYRAAFSGRGAPPAE